MVVSGSSCNSNLSRYDKLRLDPRSFESLVQDLGLDILIDQTERGMVTIAARKREST
jgi:hypothetical protein